MKTLSTEAEPGCEASKAQTSSQKVTRIEPQTLALPRSLREVQDPGPGGDGDLYFHNLALDDFSLLLDPHPDRPPERLIMVHEVRAYVFFYKVGFISLCRSMRCLWSKKNFVAEIRSESEEGSDLRLTLLYHTTLGLRVIKKRRRGCLMPPGWGICDFCFSWS